MTRHWMTRSFTALAFLLAAASAGAAGLYAEQTMTSTGDGQGMNMKVRAWADGDLARVEYQESDNPILPVGSYLLTRDGGQTVYLVNPQQQTYSVWDMDQLFAMFGQMSEMTGGMVDIDVHDPEAETLASEPGGELLGYDTMHHSWRTAFTTDIKMAFMNQSTRMETVTEAWTTDEIDLPVLGVWFRAKPPTTGDPELDQVLTDSMERLDGVVLKMRNESTTTNQKGRASQSTTLMEVTTLRAESVDQDLFVMPEGYTETPLLAGMAGMQGTQGEEEQGPLGGLKGLLGRKKKKDGNR